MTVEKSKTLTAWQERVLRMEERIRGQVLADLQRKDKRKDNRKDRGPNTRADRSDRVPPPPSRVVKDPEIAQRMKSIENYAEKARKAIVADNLSGAAQMLYEIALLADFRMTPVPRTNSAEGTPDDRSIAQRGGGVY